MKLVNRYIRLSGSILKQRVEIMVARIYASWSSTFYDRHPQILVVVPDVCKMLGPDEIGSFLGALCGKQTVECSWASQDILLLSYQHPCEHSLSSGSTPPGADASSRCKSSQWL